jgi:hypothetical protein
MKYSIYKLDKFNRTDLIQIYKSAFGYSIKLDFLENKQNTALFGHTVVGFIAYDENKNPAAFYGVYPCQIEYKGNFYLAAQSGDTMTHSNHKGKGLFIKLAIETFNYCKENGIHLVFGFPNENSFPGFIKRLGWSHFDDLTPYLIRVKCISWIRLKKTFRLPQSMHNSWCIFILKRIKKGAPFKSSCLENETPVVDHSISFFEYKTYNENYLIQLNGINVWLKFDATFLIIGDLEKCNDQRFLETVKKLKKLAFILGLPHLRFHASSNTWAQSMFEKYGYPMEVKYPVVGINFTNEVPLDQLKFTGADNDTF